MVAPRFRGGLAALLLLQLSQYDGSLGEEVGDDERWSGRSSAPAAGAAPPGGSFTTWDAVAPDRGPLGLQLSDKLIVLRLVSDEHGFAPALCTQGGVLVGDEVVAVNGEVSAGMEESLRRAVGATANECYGLNAPPQPFFFSFFFFLFFFFQTHC
jgi:hypothetical protein